MERLDCIIRSSGAHVLGGASSDIARDQRIAKGGARTEAEAQRMMTEKVAALAEARVAATVATLKGSKYRVAKKALAVYTRRVPDPRACQGRFVARRVQVYFKTLLLVMRRRYGKTTHWGRGGRPSVRETHGENRSKARWENSQDSNFCVGICRRV
jgi:hypothetical protein